MRLVNPSGLTSTIKLRATSLSIAGLLIFAPSPGLSAAPNVVLAEYRADVDPVLNTLDLKVEDSIAGERDISPWGQYRQELSGAIRRTTKIRDYFIRGFDDISLSKINTLDRHYSLERSMTVGPQISFGPRSKTIVFYSLNQADVSQVERQQWGGDSYTQSTGLAHAWYGSENRTEILLGYEYEYRSTQDLYDDMRAHSINLSGRFPLFWGVHAEVEADYSRFSYLDYQNSGAADSIRRLFRAAVERSFSEQLYGGLQFSYLDEDFNEKEFSYRRRIWGFNLKYRY